MCVLLTTWSLRWNGSSVVVPAERLGKYELVRHLASGGMARVYLARVSGVGGFERYVVLKTVRPERIEDQSYVTMFLDEARLVATLHHQHIAQVYEIGVADDGTYFLAMEYLHGETARAVLERARMQSMRLPLELGLTVVCAAASGLHHAHERRAADGTPLGIVHRDVSPSNVILGYDGAVKLIDFGIAKAEARSTKTLTGFVKGKAGYMAPEQALGYPVDRRSDVFALGVLLYELTTQTRAFRGATEYESVQRIVAGDIMPPTQVSPAYPPELEDVVMTALAVDPDDRFQDADAMRRAVEMTAHHLSIHLGMATVSRLLGELFGQRPEPWLADAKQADDLTHVDVSSAPMLAMPAAPAIAPVVPVALLPTAPVRMSAAADTTQVPTTVEGGDEVPTGRFITVDPDAPPTPVPGRATLRSIPPPPGTAPAVPLKLPLVPPPRIATGTTPPGERKARRTDPTVPIRNTPPPRVIARPPADAPPPSTPPATPSPEPTPTKAATPPPRATPTPIPSVTLVPVGPIARADVTPKPVMPVTLPPPAFEPAPPAPVTIGMGTGSEIIPLQQRVRRRRMMWIGTAAACAVAVGVIAMFAGGAGGRETFADRLTSASELPIPRTPATPTPTPKPARPPKPVAKPATPSDPAPTATGAARSDLVTLRVTSSPPGATVVLDGVRIGETPFTGTVARGREAVLKVRKRHHKPRKIKVVFDQDMNWDVGLPRR